MKLDNLSLNQPVFWISEACRVRTNATATQMSASSGKSENGVLEQNEQLVLWEADESDDKEIFLIDLGKPMAVTGLLLRTSTIQKIKVQGSMDGEQFTSSVVSCMLKFVIKHVFKSGVLKVLL